MDRFYVAIWATEANPGGEINEIDHRTLKTTNVISLAGCHPTGVAFGPDQNLYAGCGRGQIPTYGYGYSVVLDMVSNGSIVGNISGMSGLGQVIYEPSLNLYYAAAYRDLAITPGELSPGQERYSPSPRVTIINASDNTVIQSIQTENITSQTVAVDPKTKQMVVPMKKEGIVVYNIDNNSTLSSTRSARELLDFPVTTMGTSVSSASLAGLSFRFLIALFAGMIFL
jgi:DNA-binding beta-propeller fold protein YncE